MLVEAKHVSFKACTRLQREHSDRLSIVGFGLPSRLCLVDRVHGG